MKLTEAKAKRIISALIYAILFALLAEGQAKNVENSTVTLLGKVPIDVYYSIRDLQMFEDHGLLVATKSIWCSDDGGRIWSRCAKPPDQEPQNFDAAWAASPLHVFAISGGGVIEISDTCRSWRRPALPATAESVF
jgi:hypothetical protein